MNKKEKIKLRVDDRNSGYFKKILNRINNFSVIFESFESELNTSKENFVHPASQIKRFINFAIDLLIILFIHFTFQIIIAVMQIFIFRGSGLIIDKNNSFQSVALLLIIYFLYYLLFETFTGKTPGKYFTKTSVVNENGERVGFKIILYRTLSRFILFEGLSFLNSSGVGWHDSVSKTYVIED